MTNTMTKTEARNAAELACLIRLETRSQTLRRAALESEFAAAHLGERDEKLVAAIRNEIGRCDRRLMELKAGRLPRW